MQEANGGFARRRSGNGWVASRAALYCAHDIISTRPFAFATLAALAAARTAPHTFIAAIGSTDTAMQIGGSRLLRHYAAVCKMAARCSIAECRPQKLANTRNPLAMQASAQRLSIIA